MGCQRRRSKEDNLLESYELLMDFIAKHTDDVFRREESVNMCQAILEMKQEAEQRGEQNGEKKGIKKGIKKGELKKAQEDARNFYALGVDIEKIAQGVGYAKEVVKEWVGIDEPNI